MPIQPASMTLGWILLAIVAIGIELGVTNFIFLFVALAALFAAGLSALGAGVVVQAITFTLTAWLLPVLVRPQLMRRLPGRGVPSRTDMLLGMQGEVTHAIDQTQGTGRVIVNGQDWAARSTESLPVGAKVEVVGADGIVLLVETL